MHLAAGRPSLDGRRFDLIGPSEVLRQERPVALQLPGGKRRPAPLQYPRGAGNAGLRQPGRRQAVANRYRRMKGLRCLGAVIEELPQAGCLRTCMTERPQGLLRIQPQGRGRRGRRAEASGSGGHMTDGVVRLAEQRADPQACFVPRDDGSTNPFGRQIGAFGDRHHGGKGRNCGMHHGQSVPVVYLLEMRKGSIDGRRLFQATSIPQSGDRTGPARPAGQNLTVGRSERMCHSLRQSSPPVEGTESHPRPNR